LGLGINKVFQMTLVKGIKVSRYDGDYWFHYGNQLGLSLKTTYELIKRFSE
jgi:hypothetical protein